MKWIETSNDVLIMMSEVFKNVPQKLITICSEDVAEYALAGDTPLYLSFSEYDEEVKKQILEEASAWQIKCEGKETWSPEFPQADEQNTSTSIHSITTKKILVENNAFVGVIENSRDLNGDYSYQYALIKDYTGEPIYYSCYEKYGSSDREMYLTIKSYLEKRI